MRKLSKTGRWSQFQVNEGLLSTKERKWMLMGCVMYY